MTIQTNGWYARDNRMPGAAAFTVSGKVTVGSTATNVSLVPSALQDRSLGLRLDLIVESGGIGLTVMTEKTATFTLPGRSEITHVTVFYNGEELIQINDIEVVH